MHPPGSCHCQGWRVQCTYHSQLCAPGGMGSLAGASAGIHNCCNRKSYGDPPPVLRSQTGCGSQLPLFFYFVCGAPLPSEPTAANGKYIAAPVTPGSDVILGFTSLLSTLPPTLKQRIKPSLRVSKLLPKRIVKFEVCSPNFFLSV